MQKKIIAIQQPRSNFSSDVDKATNKYSFHELPFPKIDITEPFNNELIEILENTTASVITSGTASGITNPNQFQHDTISNNGKRIELLWVPHIHTEPSNTNIIFENISCFFEEATSKTSPSPSKSVVFIETIPELGRNDKKFRTTPQSFKNLLTQILNQSPNFPGENWYTAAQAALYNLPMFCPEPSESHLIEETNKIESINPVDHIAYKFFTDHYKQSKQLNDPSFKFGSLDTVLDSYIRRYAKEANVEDLKTKLRTMIDELWGRTFEFTADFFNNHSQDFEILMTPAGFEPSSIEQQTMSEGLMNYKHLVDSIRNVPLKHGLCRDLNILHELHSALHSRDVIYMVYGYGHRQTLLPGIEYLIRQF